MSGDSSEFYDEAALEAAACVMMPQGVERSQSVTLQRKTPSLSTYQTTPITKHYEINSQILAAFESHYEQKLYQVAYAIGLQFVETALLEIPKHGYYHSSRHEKERMQSSLEAARVAHILMDIQQEQKDNYPASEEKRLRQLSALAWEQIEQASIDQDAYERRRKQAEQELRNIPAESSSWVVCEPLMTMASESLTSLSQFCPPDVQRVPSSVIRSWDLQLHQQNEERRVQTQNILNNTPASNNTSASTLPCEVTQPKQQRAPQPARSDDSEVSNRGSTRAQAYRPAPPPDRMSTDDLILQKALYLSGLHVDEVDEQRDMPVPPKPSAASIDEDKQFRKSTYLEFSTLAEIYHEDFDGLQTQGRLRISYIDTYQGRLPESTNGCTIIAPLLCMHHLLDITVPDPGLPDRNIKQVIDVESSVILQDLRKQLGLAANAFLIPSDAHDCLIQNGQLSQEQFVTAHGGNILDDNHLHSFVNTLVNSGDGKLERKSMVDLGDDVPRPESLGMNDRAKSAPHPSTNGDSDQSVPVRHKKLGATFFFHEHVIAVLQIPRDGSGNTVWYDVIDSLPSKETMRKRGESEGMFCNRLGITEQELFLSEAPLPLTVRMRCLDSEALVACIRWFACSRFTDENKTYIDQYKWDDDHCDFDPRVFQAFVWGDSY